MKANLLDPHVYAFLLGIASSGKLRALLGGPPCRTVSALRFQQDDGPRPVRTEDFPYGIPEMTQPEENLVNQDVLLMYRFLALFVLAEQVRLPEEHPTQFVLEQPEDPARYRASLEVEKYGFMSVFRTEAWKCFQERYGLFQIHFDQAPMGHAKRKPTTLATNMVQLLELDGLRGPPQQQDGELKHQEKPLQERLEESRRWAAWAPGLKHAISIAVNQHLQHVSGESSLQRQGYEPSSMHLEEQAQCLTPKVQSLAKGRSSLDQWRVHFQNDHMPARRDCLHCVRSQARSKAHRRVVHPEAFTLSLDLSGRLSPGDDQAVKGCKYILLGCYTYPVDANGRSLPEVPGVDDDADVPLPPPDEIPGEQADENQPDLQQPPEPDVLHEVDDGDAIDAPESADVGAARALHGTWHKLVQEATNFSMKQLTFVEIVKSRHVKHVLPAVSRIYSRLRALGLPTYRVHTDRAREFCSDQMRSWAMERDIVPTMTPGSSYKANGRVEGEMNTIKKSIRTLISAGVCEAARWPLAARHVGERRLRSQLHKLGWHTGRLLRFGSKAFALKKSWQNRYEQWRETREEIRIMGPAIHSSLTNTSYFVQSATTGRWFYTDDLVIPDVAQPAVEDQVLYLPEQPADRAVVPRRLRGKTAPAALSMMSIEGEKMIVSRFGCMFEPLPPTGMCKPPYYETDRHDDATSDSWTLDATTDSPYQSDPDDAAGGRQPGEVPNTWAGGSHPGTLPQAQLQVRHDFLASSKLPVLRKLHHNLTEYIQEEFAKIDGTDDSQALWLPVLAQAVHQRVDLENHMLALNAAEQEQAIDVNNAEFLVTRTISNREVWDNLSDWEASIRAEHDQLVVQKQAVRQVTKAELQRMATAKGLPIELLPAKMVHTRKAPDGKYRSRAVICGNYAQEDPDSINYAGGADAVQCRALVRISAANQWELAGTDIKVAFLNAPKRDATRITACEVPTVFKRLNLAGESDVWIVERALYGLPSSPRDWGIHRDQKIPTLQWSRTVNGIQRRGHFKPSGDEHLWRMIEVESKSSKEHWVGLMSVYVDDILIGAEAGARDAAMQSLAETWNISAVEHATATCPLRFCGFEISKDINGDGFHVAQAMYEKEILAKWGIKEKASFPAFKITEDDEAIHDFQPQELREAQAVTGALLWLSTRSRPDLVYGLSAMSRLVSRNPAKTMSIGRALLAYIHGNPGGLHYPQGIPHGPWGARQQLKAARHANMLEVFSDIAYGAGTNYRSIQGLVMFYGGCPIAWQSTQQPFVTHSTAEAELVSMCEGLQSGRATEAMLCAMLGESLQNNTLERVMYGDNAAAIGFAHGATTSSWRTRHLRIRANVLREAVDETSNTPGGKWKLLHLNGKELVSDGCTKPLCGQAFFKFVEDLGMKRGQGGGTEDLSGGSTSTQHGGVQQTALKALMIGSVLMSSAKALDEHEGEGSDFIPFLVTGAILAAVGAVYVGKLMHDAACGCLKRLRSVEEDAGNRGRLDEAFLALELQQAVNVVSKDSEKNRSRRLGKGGVAAAGPMSRSSMRSSGSSVSSRTSTLNPLPQSGFDERATSSATISLTPLERSGLPSNHEERSSSLTLMRRSGTDLGSSSSLTSLRQSGPGLEHEERSSPLNPRRRSGTGNGRSSTLTSLPRSGCDDDAAESMTSLPQSGSSAVRERSLPRNAASPPGAEWVDGGIAFRNPWNLFQHLHRKKGWSPQMMSAMYERWKKGKSV